MKQTPIEFTAELEKVNTVRYFLTKKNINLEEELTGYLDTLYKKYVPQSVRDFIEDAEPYSSAVTEEPNERDEKRPCRRGKPTPDGLPADDK